MPLPFASVVSLPAATPAELGAARFLAELAGVALAPPGSAPATGCVVALASSYSAARLPAAAASTPAWLWVRLGDDGAGELLASHGALLRSGVRLLVRHAARLPRESLARGIFLPASFAWHRPHWDVCFTQYWRSARGFDPERYVAALAEAGFTHFEVNGLQSHMPFEDYAPHEYYPQFYTYGPGFNHYVDTPLTAGIWPAHYLDANLAHLRKLADLGRRHGLRPGALMFEPRTFPERFFQKFPTLRGARVDHPFRSRLPRYTLAQDHPIAQRHYREALQAMLRAVPDLSYLSLWTNDSGAGFEHTASLYVGRNGGPYLIREWRHHDKVAQAAGRSIVGFLRNLRAAAAPTHPDFEVLLRLEPFKVEHDAIVAGLGDHVAFEAPSLLVRGYALPYQHPNYTTHSGGAAGTVFHSALDPAEAVQLAAHRARGVEPVLHYSAGPAWNHEPLLGLPFPRLLHAKLLAARSAGFSRLSALGGLAHVSATPYWPNPVVLQAAQFLPEVPVDEILAGYAAELVGPAAAPALDAAWRDFEAALSWQPIVPLYCSFGFCWQRTWDRPLVPDIEAIPAADRAYYERHGCFQHHNPALNDLGRDVLFELISPAAGAAMAADFDRHVLPRLRDLVASLGRTLAGHAAGSAAHRVFGDLRDRARAYLAWCTTLRNVCAWCECVHGWLGTSDPAARAAFAAKLQASIDLELANTRDLLDLLESSPTEVIAVSGLAENTFFYGENLAGHLRTKLRLTGLYRHLPPRIDRSIYWRPAPGTAWPDGWSADAGAPAP